MTASFMHLLLISLGLWPLVSAVSTDTCDAVTLLQHSLSVAAPGAPSLGDLTFAAATASAAAAGAPAWSQLAGTALQPASQPFAGLHLKLQPVDKTSPAAPGSSVEAANELEVQARAIDEQIERSERLINEAWEGLRRAPIVPTALSIVGSRRSPNISTVGHHIEPDQRSLRTRFYDLAESVPVGQWYFFVVAITFLMVNELFIFQHLPEIERTHVCMLFFWVIVAGVFCAQVWSARGEKEGISWASGYILEIIFSIENVFIFNLIFHTLETPRRLVRKALIVTLLGSILLRFAFVLGLADAIYKVTFLPLILGAWLVYCGTQQVAVRGRCEEGADVTQTAVVRCLRWCLGERLGEFYDEEGEAIFLLSGKKSCMTLLGAAIACLLTADLFFSPDATLVKLDVIPNMYVNVSSSVIALFTLRALFFVVRDILSHLSLARYCTGIILLFVGAEMMVARFTEVSALMSLIVIVNVIMLMATFSAVKDSACPKRAT